MHIPERAARKHERYEDDIPLSVLQPRVFKLLKVDDFLLELFLPCGELLLLCDMPPILRNARERRGRK